MQVPIRIFGTDASGRVFSEAVNTVNISQTGVQITGVSATIRVDEIIGLSYGSKRSHFRVKWVGQPGTPLAGRLGLAGLNPQKPIWDTSLPGPEQDHYKWKSGERRQAPRLKCVLSSEIHAEGRPLTWANVADLSRGGCYVEMPAAIKAGTAIKIGIWIEDRKLTLSGQVASSAPGFGIGVKFVDLSDEDRAIIEAFVRRRLMNDPRHSF